MKVQVCTAVRALGPLLRQPSPDTQIATQFGTMGTQMSILEFFHTNEASEHFSQALLKENAQVTGL